MANFYEEDPRVRYPTVARMQTGESSDPDVPINPNVANTKAERDYIKNLQTKGFTGTYQSSAGKSQAVLDAEKKYEEQQAAAKTAERDKAFATERAQAEADIAGYDPDFLDAVASKLGMSLVGAVGFLKKMGRMPTKLQVPGVSSVAAVSDAVGSSPQWDQKYNSYLDQYMDDVASGEITEDEAIVAARRAANAEIENANLPSTTGTSVTGPQKLQGKDEEGTFSIDNLLSNMFGPGGRVTPGGTSFFEAEAGKQFAGERPQGLAGLQVGATNPMLATFIKMFENAPTAERRKELENIFAMLQGFTGMQQPRIGPQALAYQFSGG